MEGTENEDHCKWSCVMACMASAACMPAALPPLAPCLMLLKPQSTMHLTWHGAAQHLLLREPGKAT